MNVETNEMASNQDNDITQNLRSTEDALGDFIAEFLEQKFGPNWIYECEMPETKIEEWEKRKKEEEAKQTSGSVEQRLIYPGFPG